MLAPSGSVGFIESPVTRMILQAAGRMPRSHSHRQVKLMCAALLLSLSVSPAPAADSSSAMVTRASSSYALLIVRSSVPRLSSSSSSSSRDRGSSVRPARYSTETRSTLATVVAVRRDVPTLPCSIDDRWLALVPISAAAPPASTPGTSGPRAAASRTPSCRRCLRPAVAPLWRSLSCARKLPHDPPRPGFRPDRPEVVGHGSEPGPGPLGQPATAVDPQHPMADAVPAERAGHCYAPAPVHHHHSGGMLVECHGRRPVRQCMCSAGVVLAPTSTVHAR